MAKHHPSFLLLLLLTATVSATSPPANTTTTTFPLLQVQDDQQMNNIIDAMVGSGDLSVSATFFIPSNDFRFPLLDPFIFPYHIVPQRLSFSDLLLLKPLSRLPTLLPSKSILVTNTSSSNFTLDNSIVSYPDLYLTSSISVHGIQNILDYSVYGGSRSQSTPSLPPSTPPPPQASRGLFVEEGEVAAAGRRSSDAISCFFREFPVILLVFNGVLGISLVSGLYSKTE